MPKTEESVLTVTPARDITIANTRRVICPDCGLMIGRVMTRETTDGALYYCRKCKAYYHAKVKISSVP